MKIVNVSGKEIEACVKFIYKGFEISITNLCQPNEIRIYGGERYNTHMTEKITGESQESASIEGIQRVISAIDKYTG